MTEHDDKEHTRKGETGVWPTLRLRYSFPRIQWLVVTMASVSALYLSSQEIWSTVGDKPYPHVSNGTIVIYCAFFLVVAFLIHLKDVENVASKSHVIILVAVASISVDVGFLCLSEFITLLSISVLPQDPLSIAKLLILGAMPGSLGVVTLNSLTASSLRERASKLNREVKELTKQVQDLDKHREQRQTEFNEFKKKTRTFMKAVGKDKDAQ